jgi:hypothetical protein
MERKVDFVACDMPSANAFMINVYAAVAQEERRMISDRTKAGLAAADSTRLFQTRHRDPKSRGTGRQPRRLAPENLAFRYARRWQFPVATRQLSCRYRRRCAASMAELVFVTKRELTEPRHPELAHYLAQFSLEIPARSRRCRAGPEVFGNESELLSTTRALEFRVTALSRARRVTLIAALGISVSITALQPPSCLDDQEQCQEE